MTIYEKLLRVQVELKAPKGQYNSFGKYKYRSCEDILTAVKPLLDKVGATITLSDDIFLIGDRFYVKATATFHDVEKGSTITNSALAREDENKKGMDSSQVTGATSSYARKYALNGLFLLDDVKDADTDEYVEQTKEQKNEQPKPKTKQPDVSELILKFQELKGKLTKIGVDIHADAFVKWLCENAKVGTTDPGKLKPEELDRVVKCMDSALKAKQK